MVSPFYFQSTSFQSIFQTFSFTNKIVIADVLAVGATTSVLMAINFNDTTQPAQFELCAGDLKYNVKISAPVGELLQPYTINESEFKLQKSKLFTFHFSFGYSIVLYKRFILPSKMWSTRAISGRQHIQGKQSLEIKSSI